MTVRKRKEDNSEVFPKPAGIDLGGVTYWVAVPRQADDETVREFGTMTGDLNPLADQIKYVPGRKSDI